MASKMAPATIDPKMSALNEVFPLLRQSQPRITREAVYNIISGLYDNGFAITRQSSLEQAS